MTPSLKWATAQAPATVANMAVGFDCLGFAVPVASDRVKVTQVVEYDDVRIRAVVGGGSIPTDPQRNTATVALSELRRRVQFSGGFEVEIEKGIPLASGLGGSAASAVAAVVAAAALIDADISAADLLAAASVGEGAVSGASHADNTGPSLSGGAVLILDHSTHETVPLRVPREVVCSLVHPHLEVETRTARSILAESIPLGLHTQQSALLAGFVLACERDDWDQIGKTMRDVVIEPQRAQLVPHFAAVQQAGLAAGALGLSISGAGPTLFAWSRGRDTAQAVTAAMAEAFQTNGVEVDVWTTEVDPRGAFVLEQGTVAHEVS